MSTCPENTYVMCGLHETPVSEVVVRTATDLAQTGYDFSPALIVVGVVIALCGGALYEWRKA